MISLQLWSVVGKNKMEPSRKNGERREKPGSKQFKQPKYGKQSLSRLGNIVMKQRRVEHECLIATED